MLVTRPDSNPTRTSQVCRSMDLPAKTNNDDHFKEYSRLVHKLQKKQKEVLDI